MGVFGFHIGTSGGHCLSQYDDHYSDRSFDQYAKPWHSRGCLRPCWQLNWREQCPSCKALRPADFHLSNDIRIDDINPYFRVPRRNLLAFHLGHQHFNGSVGHSHLCSDQPCRHVPLIFPGLHPCPRHLIKSCCRHYWKLLSHFDTSCSLLDFWG